MSKDEKSIPASSPDAEPLNRLHRLVLEMRGAFVDQTIWIDVLVTDLLAHYFSPDPVRRSLLHSEVLTGRDASFNGRLEVLEDVVNLSFPDFKKKYPLLFKSLSNIRRLRNRLAHAQVDNGDEFLRKGYTDRIQLVFHEKGSKRTQIIMVPEFKERLKECTKCILALVELQQLISPVENESPTESR